MTTVIQHCRVEYVGNAATVNFAVDFEFGDDDELLVYLGDVLQTLTTHYSVSGGDGSTGTVTFNTAPANLVDVVIIGDPEVTQETDYTPNDPFPAQSHEAALDKLTRIVRRRDDIGNRSFRLSDTQTGDIDLEIPEPDALKYWRWNAAADAIQFVALTNASDLVYNDLINEDTTLDVPADYADIKAAFTYLADKTIASGVTVTIQVADGTHDYSGVGTVNMNHPQGKQIRVLGDTTTPTNCVIDVGDSTSTAFLTDAGNILGLFDGFWVKHNSQKTATHGDNWDSSSTGILADDGGSIYCGSAIVVSDFFYGISARQRAYVQCRDSVVYNAGDVGIWAFQDSFIDAIGAEAYNCQNDANGLGSGFTAEYGSFILGTDTLSHDNYFNGFTCRSNSSMRLLDSVSHTNTKNGYFTSDSAHLQLGGSNTYGNGEWGVRTTQNSFFSATGGMTFVGAPNTLGDISNNILLGSNDDGEAQVAADENGPIYYKTKGGGSHYFETAADKIQFEVENSAGTTVNRPAARGSITGEAPRFSAVGADANLYLDLYGKGTGSPRTQASTTSKPAMNIPHGGTPASPVDGDIWTTTAGLFVRINGVTVGPLT